MQKLTKKELEYIDLSGNLGKKWGLGEISGRIMGVISITQNSMTQKEIAQTLGNSLSLISPALSMLETLGFLSKKKRDNSPEKEYSVRMTLNEIFGFLMQQSLEQDIKPMLSLLHDIRKDRPKKQPCCIRTELKKLESALKKFKTHILGGKSP